PHDPHTPAQTAPAPRGTQQTPQGLYGSRAKPSCQTGPQWGSSDFRWGSGLESSGDEEHAEAVVGQVAVAAGQAPVELDDAVHGLGAAVVGSAGGEVGQERVLPAA